MDAETVIDRSIERARDTLIFEHPDWDHYIILKHPGQQAPKLDAVSLRHEFGIMPQHTHHIHTLAESDKHRPRPLAEISAERAGNRQARITELRAELAKLLAQEGDENAAEPAGAAVDDDDDVVHPSAGKATRQTGK